MSLADSIKGKIGETLVANELGWSKLLGFSGKVLKNVYIPKEDGTTAEIDLLYITSKGIFVIESKNYVGYIFGRDIDTYWTVSVYKGKNFFGSSKTEKHRFYNPIKQNKSHIKWLNSYLGKDISMFSCIVFSEKSELKSIDLSSSSYNIFVCNRKYMVRNIRKLWKQNPDVLDELGIETLYEKLKPLSKVSATEKHEHIKQIKESENSVACPVCGGELVVRTSIRNGKKFYGCSNYPQCRYTRSL